MVQISHFSLIILTICSFCFPIFANESSTFENKQPEFESWSINLRFSENSLLYGSFISKSINEVIFTLNSDYSLPKVNDNVKEIVALLENSNDNEEFGFTTLKCIFPCSVDILISTNSKGKPQTVNFFNLTTVYSKEEKLPLIIKNVTISPIKNGVKPRVFLDFIDEHSKAKVKEESSSFIVKYWYIIIPGMILFMMAGAPEGDESKEK